MDNEIYGMYGRQAGAEENPGYKGGLGYAHIIVSAIRQTDGHARHSTKFYYVLGLVTDPDT